jgi:hypothetical protein
VLLAGCGGAAAPAPEPPPQQTAPVHTPPPEIRTEPQGLQLTFLPTVKRETAVHYVMQCQAFNPEGHPSAAGLACPIDLKKAQIDISEAPAGTSLMIHTPNPQVSESLRLWFEEHQRIGD